MQTFVTEQELQLNLKFHSVIFDTLEIIVLIYIQVKVNVKDLEAKVLTAIEKTKQKHFSYIKCL